LVLTTALKNVTAVQIQGARSPPLYKGGYFYISVMTSNAATNTVLATLSNQTTPFIGELYTVSGQNYLGMQTSTTATYNQQNGQPTTTWSLAQSSLGSIGKPPYGLFAFSMNEIAVPANTAATDALQFGVYNNTAGVTISPNYVLNYSIGGTHNNATYISTQGLSSNNIQAGFRTERGSKVASIGANGGTQDTFNLAEAVDWLQFSVGSSTGNTPISRSFSLHGPYTIGQATNIPNVSIGAVNATIALTGNSVYKISGISNLTATPSLSVATHAVWLSNLTTSQPLVLMDNSSQLNSGSSLILIGSGYVNSLSATLEKAYNITADTTPGASPVTQAVGTNKILIAGYAANQTTQAANNFITQLYLNAATTNPNH
jgi:hypothetical protein